MSVYTFDHIAGTDGHYRVKDKLSQLVTVGTVHKVYRGRTVAGWMPVPPGETVGEDGPRFAYPTRYRAAHALARYAEDGNRDWISPQ